ncbi:MAG TPA: hypothetical protein ENJ32_04985, partial [Crenotrichaceae bacterium]|nr:hypothetical protein [Crenotrichaceae bacterium]
MKFSSTPGLGNGLTRMFFVSLALVIAIGLSFIIHTERQFAIKQMHAHAALVFTIIEELITLHENATNTFLHDDILKWTSPLNQLAQHYHLSIRMSRADDRNQLLYVFPQDQVDSQVKQNHLVWIHRLLSVEPFVIDKSFSRKSLLPVQVEIQVHPYLDLVEVKQRLFAFLAMMALLAILVYATIKIMTARFLRELNVINKGIKQIETGYYNTRLPDFYFSELTDISDSYNQAMSQLEKICR